MSPAIDPAPAAALPLSPGQASAMAAVLESINTGSLITSLSGPGGSGKTYSTREIIRRLAPRPVTQLSPTGKAASRQRVATGFDAQTIHKPLYRQVNEADDGQLWFAKPGPVCPPGHLVIIDEIGMVGERLFFDVLDNLEPGCQILGVGDEAQLGPVRDRPAVDLTRATAKLTEIHRQAWDSPIIRLATNIRMAPRRWDWPCMWRQAEVDIECDACFFWPATLAEVVIWLADCREDGLDAVGVCYTNETRRLLNSLIARELRVRGLIDAAPGDSAPAVGDRLVCLRNNYALGWYNGEQADIRGIEMVTLAGQRVAACDLWGDTRRALLPPGLPLGCAGSDFYDFEVATRDAITLDKNQAWVHVDRGEVLTAHKCQGSGYDFVAVIDDGPVRSLSARNFLEYRRWMYTAVTRAAKAVGIFSLGGG